MAGITYRVVQLRTVKGREETIEIETGFASIMDALAYCDLNDPDSEHGYRAESFLTVERRTDSYPGALSSQAEEGYVIVSTTGGIMAGPYETAEFAESVRTLCGVMPDTRVEKARIV